MSTTLLNLSDEIAKLDDLLAAADNAEDKEVQEALARLLDLTSQRESKINGYCGLIREMELRAEARKAEAKRLMEASDRAAALADNLKARLLFALKSMDIKKIETPLYTVTRANNGGKLPMVVDEENVPLEYQELVQSTKVNKDKIRADLEAGKVLTFAKLGERGERLSIK